MSDLRARGLSPVVVALVVAAILAVYVAVFARTTGYAFVWDDVHEIARNPAFDRGLVDGLGLTQTERNDPALTELSELSLAYDSYRPLLFASQWLDVQLWGRSAGALHAMNILYGALAILLAFALARRYLPSGPALVATAVFALHPLQVETIAYVSARGDLLAGLAALAAAYGWTRGGRWIAVAALGFAASLLCKEAYLGLPAALAALAWSRGELRARLPALAVLGAVLVGYFALRAAMVTATTGGAVTEALRALPAVWLEYLRAALLPLGLSSERLHQATPAAAPVALAVIALAVVAVRRWPGCRLAVAGLAWFAVLLGPSAVAVASTGVAADRYAYLPLFGLALALATAVHRRPVAVAAAALGALWLWLAIAQVPAWRDNRALYTHAVAREPDSSLAHYRLAYLDAQAGDWDAALPRLAHAVELDPRNLRALNNLGVGLLRTGQLAEAEPILVRALAANPVHFRAWLNLGVARIQLGRRAEGCAAISRALEINPGYQAALAEQARSCPLSP